MSVEETSTGGSPGAIDADDSHRHRALAEFGAQFDYEHRNDISPSKRRILETFLTLCVSHGIESASMRTLANELNIKAPSIYSHFPGGRDEIVTKSLQYHFQQFCEGLLDAVAPTRNASEFWDAMVRLHFTRQVRLPESDLWDLIVATDRTAHILPSELSTQVNHWVALYESLYVAAARDMGFDDTERRVKVVMTLLEGSSRWFDTTWTEESLFAGAEQAVLMSRHILALPIV
ncbi:TetR/AcrR family transcriptional regulator [Gordonia polyisoprenivorans]|uniref:TetR/AcrR family transcriptional regulator n=1 Tax=Gordonia polyisoprenivorans TaxID=84595 RepID=UPI001A0C6817|nr:TetR/AcrR family transcriptional regulator [Gordonia polyisoprenivorans]MBE7191111.1 TetR/AcrR family transcriptional regulator [Gordonia polyisoprenivorans]UZF55441.1 TetR/AcrR family transcriptional regulator [Gordonia polyisoprenivorans]